jgi:soluble lytic murein transglycosylase-like protein
MATAEQIAAVYQAADAAGVPRDLFFRLVKQESAFRPDVWGGQRRSSAGAIGPAQLMPGTAAELGVDPYDINANLLGGARYLRQQLDTFGDPALALAAYNAGPGRVRQAGGVPNIEGNAELCADNPRRYGTSAAERAVRRQHNRVSRLLRAWTRR